MPKFTTENWIAIVAIIVPAIGVIVGIIIKLLRPTKDIDEDVIATDASGDGPIIGGIKADTVNVTQIQGGKSDAYKHLQIDRPSSQTSDLPVKEVDSKHNNSQNKCLLVDTYDSDMPPLIDIWVGRKSELEQFSHIQNSVIAITGIGGQGKSTLAAKALERYRKDYPDHIWNWRDCREQSDRFRTQLVSVIEFFSMGKVTAEQVSDANISWLSKYFFREFGSRNAFLVFDNVDHYVNVESCQFTSDVSAFVEEALRVEHNIAIVFTCRPRISYPSVRFNEVYLRGLALNETIELYKLKIPCELTLNHNDIIKKFYKITRGHPFWLTIIFSQIGRKPQIQSTILKQLEAGGVDDTTNSMLRGVWAGLNDDHKKILKYMAELPRAMEAGRVFEYMDGAVRKHNRFDRCFRMLKTISLIVEKGEGGSSPNRFELHPIVRAFIRKEYRDNTERSEVLGTLLLCCDKIVIQLRGKNSKSLSTEMLEQLITKAEFQIALDKVEDAIETLTENCDALISRGLQEEFIRLARLVLIKTNWSESNWLSEESFDSLIQCLSKIMVEIGQIAELRPIMAQYKSIISHGTSRYIGLCDLYAYIEWFLGDFQAAINWARQGVELKNKSGIDTKFDSSHNLALAQRDSGQVDQALEYFCFGVDIDSILVDDHLNSGRNASFYGNIGRCLAYKGKTQKALHLYAKSYDLLTRQNDSMSILNLGYAAFWIGEALESLEQWDNSYRFYKRATAIWECRSPRLAEGPHAKLSQLESLVNDPIKNQMLIHVKDSCSKWVRNELKTT